jgi:hypothetical protein
MLRILLVLSFSLPACSAFALIPPKNAGLSNINRATSALNYANGNKDDVLPFTLRLFDLNGDGKIDEKDLQIFQRNTVERLDLNGDGELNEKDLAKALQLVIFSWALSASPAAAKGGGHGGGGGGHGGGGHSSSSRSSSFRSSGGGGRSYSGRSNNDFKAYYRQWYGRNSKYDKPWNPAACNDLPGEGEEVKVATGPYSYAPAVVTTANGDMCTFSVQVLQQQSKSGDSAVDDGSTFIQSFHTMRNWGDTDLLLPLYCVPLSLIAAVGETVSRIQAYQKDKAFDEAFARQAALEETGNRAIPTSGKYTGSTQESDGANQAIKVDLHFNEETREINGSGYDSDDGRYSVEGEWIGSKVKWTESYSREGFTVEVRGSLNKDATKLDCWFVASRGVRGTFVLRKKQPWTLFP